MSFFSDVTPRIRVIPSDGRSADNIDKQAFVKAAELALEHLNRESESAKAPAKQSSSNAA